MDGIRFIIECRVEKSLQERKSTAKEIFFYWTFKRPVQIVKMVITALVVLNHLWCLSIGYIPTPASWLLLVVWLSILPMNYFTGIRRYIKHGEDIRYKNLDTIKLGITDEAIYPSVTDESYYLEISSIKYAYLTKNYIILVTKNKNSLVLNKNGFVKGDYNSFCQFLESKNIKVKS